MIQKLLKYQEIDKQLKEIETELLNSEERKKAKSAEKYLAGVADNVNKLDLKASELIANFERVNKQLDAFKEQEKEFEKATKSAEDEKEISFLIKKIEELLSKIKLLTADADKIYNEIQAVLKEYKEIRETTKKAQIQYKESGEKYNLLKNSKNEQMTSIKSQLAEINKTISDASLMEKYLKRRNDKIFPVLYEVTDRVCGYCNMELSLKDLSELKNGVVIECDQCKRLLYKK